MNSILLFTFVIILNFIKKKKILRLRLSVDGEPAGSCSSRRLRFLIHTPTCHPKSDFSPAELGWKGQPSGTALSTQA